MVLWDGLVTGSLCPSASDVIQIFLFRFFTKSCIYFKGSGIGERARVRERDQTERDITSEMPSRGRVEPCQSQNSRAPFGSPTWVAETQIYGSPSPASQAIYRKLVLRYGEARIQAIHSGIRYNHLQWRLNLLCHNTRSFQTCLR